MVKYARLVYGPNDLQSSKNQYANLGDYFQTYAIDHLYELMGISEDNIIEIDRSHLADYSGETCILPMQGWFGHIKGIDIYPLPDSIIPVYIGYHSVDKLHYTDGALTTLREHMPICCRDEATRDLMTSYGIEAYLTGCMTVTLPTREIQNGTTVFLVDAPDGIEEYIPESLRSSIEYITQEVPYKCTDSASEIRRLDRMASNLLERYRTEAALVVTSRLHCAAPCLGMGIPVILARKYFDERYGWIEKYLSLYTPDHFSEIDWFPQVPDLSNIKPHLIKLACSILRGEPATQDMTVINEFYEQRDKFQLNTPVYVKAYHYLHGRFPRLADFLRERLLQRFTVASGRNKTSGV